VVSSQYNNLPNEGPILLKRKIWLKCKSDIYMKFIRRTDRKYTKNTETCRYTVTKSRVQVSR